MAPTPLGVPERIGCYRVDGLLGRGGMGEVYRGWDERLERPVALKRLQVDEAKDPGKSRERFRREARSVARVSHSAIVQVYDWVEGEDADWIVMELVDGDSLRDLVAGGALPPKTVARIGRQIASGLAAAHRAGLVHRDLKAENVMLTSAGEVRVLDFGLAKRVSQEDGVPLSTRISRTGEVVGTVTAMSPEQALGQPVDHRTDLFSLGTLLYHLATGVLPFTGDSSVEILTRICTVQAVPLRRHHGEIPEDLARIVEGLLEKDPAHRPQDAGAVAEALEAVAAGFPSGDTREGLHPAAAARAAAATGETVIGGDSVAAPGLLGGETGTRVRTLLLNDLVDSTKLVEKLGDERAARIFEQHDRLARDLLKQHRGREIDKSDGFLMLFERPIDAVRFALGYHRALAEISGKEGVEVASRVGIHVGEVVLRANTRLDVSRGAKPLEVEGLAKAMAARFMSLAGARQTLISRGVYDLARRSAVGATDLPEGLRWVEHGRYRMQGVEEPVEVFEVGAEGMAPLAAPAGTRKVRQVAEEKGVFVTHRRLAGAAALAVLVVAGGTFQQWLGAVDPIRVAVPAPEAARLEAPLDPILVRGAVRGALLRGLTSLEGVSVTPTDQVDAVAGTSLDVARAVAADEVVTARVECSGLTCQIVLSRILAETGDAAWAATFTTRADDPLGLDAVVVQHLRRGWDRAVRSGAADLEVGAADYAAFLRLSQAVDGDGRTLPRSEILAGLGEIVESSPRFLGARLRLADVASMLYFDSRDGTLLDTALEAARAAHEIAPEEPLPLFALGRVARNAELVEVWEEAVAGLEELRPGNPHVLAQRALLLERRGEGAEALARMREAAALLPSWDMYHNLGMMEYRQGEIDAARGRLERALELVPTYTVRGELAQLELLNGDPRRAVGLYEALVEEAGQFAHLVNLGLAYLLVGRYGDAVAAGERVVEQAPGSPVLLLNLADAEWLLGRKEEALEHYRRVVEILAGDPFGESWQGKTVRAQALAHLGELERAVALVQEGLRLAPENPQAALEAAMVYALAGERTSAIVNVERAIAGGVEPRWFGFPWFDGLRDDARFQELVGGAGGAQGVTGGLGGGVAEL